MRAAVCAIRAIMPVRPTVAPALLPAASFAAPSRARVLLRPRISSSHLRLRPFSTTPLRALQAEPFDPSPLPGSTQKHSAHLILHAPYPPHTWPAKVEAVSPLYRALSSDPALAEAGVLVGLAWDGVGAEAPKEGAKEEVWRATLYPSMREITNITLESAPRLVMELVAAAQKGEALDRPSGGETHVYVCTHGARDCRCGDAGGAVVQALREEVQKRRVEKDVHVREIAHVGGHKWAANAIVFPSGDWYGNLRPSDVPTLLSLSHPPNLSSASSVLWPHWRGRLGVDPALAPAAAAGQTLNPAPPDAPAPTQLKPRARGAESDAVRVQFRDVEGGEFDVEGKVGESLMQLGRREKLGNVEGVCDGRLECATCHMFFPLEESSNPPSFLPEISDAEDDMLQYAIGYDPDRSRLGCQIRVTRELGEWCARGGVIELPRY